MKLYFSDSFGLWQTNLRKGIQMWPRKISQILQIFTESVFGKNNLPFEFEKLYTLYKKTHPLQKKNTKTYTKRSKQWKTERPFWDPECRISLAWYAQRRKILKGLPESAFVIFHRRQSSTHHLLSRQAIYSLTHLLILSDLSNRSLSKFFSAKSNLFYWLTLFRPAIQIQKDSLCVIEHWNQEDSQLQKNIWLLWEGCCLRW